MPKGYCPVYNVSTEEWPLAWKSNQVIICSCFWDFVTPHHWEQTTLCACHPFMSNENYGIFKLQYKHVNANVIFHIWLLSDNWLKVQYYLSFDKHCHIYSVFIPTLIRKYEGLQIFFTIYSLHEFFSRRRLKLINWACKHESKRI